MNRLHVITAILIAGIVLSIVAVHTTTMAGSVWFNEKKDVNWHMTNDIVVPGSVAFMIFGVAAFYIGGIFTGTTMPIMFARIRKKSIIIFGVIALILALTLTGLGFNTLDWTLGSMYWNGDGVPPPDANMNLLSIHFTIDVWNQYFFIAILPLWISGFLIGISITVIAMVWQFVKNPL